MNRCIVPIVEGYADVASVPALLRRTMREMGRYDIDVARPIRVPRQKVTKEGELERWVLLALRREGCSAILVILDADDDCPAELAPMLVDRATRESGPIPVAVVLPTREWESWFVGSVESLSALRSLRPDARAPASPESIRDPKRWLSNAMVGDRYVTADDQVSFTDAFDMGLAATRCRSFRKFQKAVSELLAVVPAAEG